MAKNVLLELDTTVGKLAELSLLLQLCSERSLAIGPSSIVLCAFVVSFIHRLSIHFSSSTVENVVDLENELNSGNKYNVPAASSAFCKEFSLVCDIHSSFISTSTIRHPSQNM